MMSISRKLTMTHFVPLRRQTNKLVIQHKQGQQRKCRLPKIRFLHPSSLVLVIMQLCHSVSNITGGEIQCINYS